MVGADAENHPELIDMFLGFDNTVDNTIGLSSFLPGFLRFIVDMPISISYNKFRKIFVPIIQKRRADPSRGQGGLVDFMPFILEVADNDKRASGRRRVSRSSSY